MLVRDSDYNTLIQPQCKDYCINSILGELKSDRGQGLARSKSAIVHSGRDVHLHRSPMSRQNLSVGLKRNMAFAKPLKGQETSTEEHYAKVTHKSSRSSVATRWRGHPAVWKEQRRRPRGNAITENVDNNHSHLHLHPTSTRHSCPE